MTYPVDGRHLAEWLGKYDSLKRSYLGGFCSRIEAVDGLRNLRYRDDALRIELLEWEREKERLRIEKLRREHVERLRLLSS